MPSRTCRRSTGMTPSRRSRVSESDSLPSSTSCMTTTAVIVFATLAMRNGVLGVMRLRAAGSAWPPARIAWRSFVTRCTSTTAFRTSGCVTISWSSAAATAASRRSAAEPSSRACAERSTAPSRSALPASPQATANRIQTRMHRLTGIISSFAAHDLEVRVGEGGTFAACLVSEKDCARQSTGPAAPRPARARPRATLRHGEQFGIEHELVARLTKPDGAAEQLRVPRRPDIIEMLEPHFVWHPPAHHPAAGQQHGASEDELGLGARPPLAGASGAVDEPSDGPFPHDASLRALVHHAAITRDDLERIAEVRARPRREPPRAEGVRLEGRLGEPQPDGFSLESPLDRVPERDFGGERHA